MLPPGLACIIPTVHLYVHVPFCARRCSYCDFAIAVRREVPTQAFVSAITKEWKGRLSEPAWNGSPGLDTIYFGGGTPSRLFPGGIAELLACFRADRALAEGAEVTLEANPEDVSPAAADVWRAAGVNRISLGAQSFSPRVLEWMHRTHDAARVGQAVRTLRAAGYGNISLDLIYGVPEHLDRNWARELEQAFALEPEHLSLYALTVEPHTALGHWTARGETIPAPDDRAAEEFLMTHERLSAAGYDHYEVSNAARPGRRALHNAAYWRRAPFIGLGPSAHSGSGRRRSWNAREWEEYRRRVESGVPTLAGEELLDERAVRLEELYLGLRTDSGAPLEAVPRAVRRTWAEAGWAEEDGSRVRLTPDGWLRLDALVASVPERESTDFTDDTD
jgi:oxygen-independent coproporphyrinogen-3 oxidase